MPEYVIKVSSELSLWPKDLERLEDVVYDVFTKEWAGATDVDPEGVGYTDVEAIYN